jgi:hypothetical protein
VGAAQPQIVGVPTVKVILEVLLKRAENVKIDDLREGRGIRM